MPFRVVGTAGEIKTGSYQQIPMSKKSSEPTPFLDGEPVIPPIFAGREKELDEIALSVVDRSQSITISGYDTVGKSSLVATFLADASFSKTLKKGGILPIRISENELYQSIRTDFLSSITHLLCAKVWTEVFKRNYSELLEETLLYPRNTDLSKKSWKLLKRIFQIVTSEGIGSSGSRKSEFGGKLVLDGRSSEENQISIQRKGLQPFEFMMLIDEIVGVLAKHDYRKVLFVCDQLNHLPPKVNYELIESYIDVFSSKKIMFILSAEERVSHYENRVDTKDLLDSFSNRVRLSPFESPTIIADVIDSSFAQSSAKKLAFSADGVERIFEVTEGYPWFAVRLCDLSYRLALKADADEVGVDFIQAYAVPFSKALATYKENDGSMARRHLAMEIERSQ